MLVGRRPGPPPVVTKISAKTLRRKIVSIRMTTVIGRARCGSDDVAEEGERSRAVHLGRLLLLLVERLEGREEDERGEGQPLPGDDEDDGEQRHIGEPVDRRERRRAARSRRRARYTGCISRFFQISALTVGMTKKGAMTSRRTMPWPEDRLVQQQREQRAADHA